MLTNIPRDGPGGDQLSYRFAEVGDDPFDLGEHVRSKLLLCRLGLEDLRVQVGDHVDPGPKQDCMNDPVLFVVAAERPRVGQRWLLWGDVPGQNRPNEQPRPIRAVAQAAAPSFLGGKGSPAW